MTSQCVYIFWTKFEHQKMSVNRYEIPNDVVIALNKSLIQGALLESVSCKLKLFQLDKEAFIINQNNL